MIKSLLVGIISLLALPALAETSADRFAPRRSFSTDIWEQWLSTDDIVSTPGFLDTYPDYPKVVPASAFAALVAHGFDTIRIAADPAPMQALWGTDRMPGLLTNLHARVTEAQAAGFKVILDLHIMPRPGEIGDVDATLADEASFATYVQIVSAVAAMLTDLDPDRTALEPMNEPTEDCDPIYSGAGAMLWPAHLARLHDAARKAAPNLPLVLSGACWGGADGLAVLDPASLQDDNVIWSFHTYDPFSFSHQGANWTGSPLMFVQGMPFPPQLLTKSQSVQVVNRAVLRAKASSDPVAAQATRAALSQIVNDYRREPASDAVTPITKALAWADAHGIPHHRLFLGEFGSLWRPDDLNAPDPDSHFRFLSAKVNAAVAGGMGWSVWSFSGSMGITDPGYGLNAPTCKALALPHCSAN